ncbi:ATP-grasp domain-containing protein [Nocardioides sp. KIGAM211]|uniref:ATP-grasp domain-containing protein n=1 Tax=Nocardioides luti TaxID=2761101 RepID=A0A7X0RLJ7_9ACTN|nr:ATP-grasp domain-containing protein [Nocardioides luti]
MEWHELGEDVVASVTSAVTAGGYDVVLPGGDAELLALSEARDDIPCVVPYGTRESVRCILDKLAMTEAAARVGLGVPRTRPATDEEIDTVTATMVLKSRSHALLRSETLVSDDPAELRAAADAMRASGAEPILQEHCDGRLIAVSLVLGDDARVLAAVQQQATGLWPPEAGISVSAETVETDPVLVEQLAGFLDSIGWRGLAEAQFLETRRGPLLIDVNGRCYGSMALASAAGVDLAAVWATSSIGEDVIAPAAEAGVRYQWLYGDVRRGWRSGRDVLGPLVKSWRATHSVWSLRDPKPSMSYLRTLFRSVRDR